MTDRRGFLARGLAGASTLLLTGCYDLSQQPWFVGALGKVEDLTRTAQHLFAGPHTLAPEFTKADIAPVFRANGTLDPGTPEYAEKFVRARSGRLSSCFAPGDDLVRCART